MRSKFLLFMMLYGCDSTSETEKAEEEANEETDTTEETEETDTTEETEETDTTEEVEEERELPEVGCELEGYVQFDDQEYYSFMYAYNDAQLLTYEETNDFSQGFDNQVDERHWYEHNEEGLVWRQQDDLNGDGTIDLNYERVYVDSFMTEQRLDWDNDEVFDAEWLLSRDEDGYILSQTYDEGIDGTIDTIWTNEWNEDMTFVTMSEDQDNDGTVDALYEFTLDAEARMTTTATDEDADGVWESKEAYEYNDDDNVTVYRLDSDGDELWDYTIAYSWLNATQWQTIVENTYTNGEVTSTYTYEMFFADDGFSDYVAVTGSAVYTIDHTWYCAE